MSYDINVRPYIHIRSLTNYLFFLVDHHHSPVKARLTMLVGVTSITWFWLAMLPTSILVGSMGIWVQNYVEVIWWVADGLCVRIVVMYAYVWFCNLLLWQHYDQAVSPIYCISTSYCKNNYDAAIIHILTSL